MAVETREIHTEAPPQSTRPRIPVPSLPRVVELPTRWERLRRNPFLRVVAYYAILITVVAALVTWVPVVRRAFITPVFLTNLAEGELLTGDAVTPGPISLYGVLDRAFTTLLVIAGALSLVIPIAWVYMFIKRLRFDPALVRSVIILPIVVAGIAMVVKNSVALAFALAGIVAAVRFRNTLKDPRDAVYIFLAIAIGLSAGVQALDVALVMSMAFNLVVLFLWQFNVGSIYGGRYGRTGVLSAGNPALLVAQGPEERRRIRKNLLEEAEEMKTDGILLVHSPRPELARHTVQEAFGELAKDWRLVGIVPRGEELSTLEYLVRLKKKATAAELVGVLGDRWSSVVAAAEYLPFRKRKRSRKGEKGASGLEGEREE